VADARRREILTRTAVLALVGVILMTDAPPVAAQPIEFPTNCTESWAVGRVFIGHDCGDWASILISGRTVIRKPWSRANRASRAVRLRERRGGDNSSGPPSSPPGSTQGQVSAVVHCTGAPERTIIRNGTAETITVTRIRSLYEDPVESAELGLPDPEQRIAPGESLTVETGGGADRSTGGIESHIYNDQFLEDEGARIETSAGTITAPCSEAQ
jgi:hypothetical protein